MQRKGAQDLARPVVREKLTVMPVMMEEMSQLVQEPERTLSKSLETRELVKMEATTWKGEVKSFAPFGAVAGGAGKIRARDRVFSK